MIGKNAEKEPINDAPAQPSAIRDRDAEIERLEEEVAFWAGEGQKDNPLMIEWQALLRKKPRTPADDARMGKLARQARIDAENEPELRARIAEMGAEIDRLLDRLRSSAES